MRTYIYFVESDLVAFSKKNKKGEYIIADIKTTFNKLYFVNISYKPRYTGSYGVYDNYVCRTKTEEEINKLKNLDLYHEFNNPEDLLLAIFNNLNTDKTVRLILDYKHERKDIYINKNRYFTYIRNVLNGPIIKSIRS